MLFMTASRKCRRARQIRQSGNSQFQICNADVSSFARICLTNCGHVVMRYNGSSPGIADVLSFEHTYGGSDLDHTHFLDFKPRSVLFEIGRSTSAQSTAFAHGSNSMSRESGLTDLRLH